MSQTQYSLFDHFEVARKSDPETSVAAAQVIEPKLSGRRAEFVRCLREIGRPATAQEIAAVADVEIRESVRKRAAECERLGFVARAGTKACDVTGQRAAVYWVV